MTEILQRGPAAKADHEAEVLELPFAAPEFTVRAGASRSTAGRRVAVVGCGHVGLVLAGGLVKLGHQVVGVDVAEALVADLNDGVMRLHEPGLAELLSEGLTSGLLRFTTSYAEAVPEAELIFIAVDTPQTLAGAADLRNIRNATHSIAQALNGIFADHRQQEHVADRDR